MGFFILLEVPDGTGGWIFTLDMSVRRIHFRDTGTLFRTPWQKSREDEGSNQNRSDENGEGMWSRNI